MVELEMFLQRVLGDKSTCDQVRASRIGDILIIDKKGV